MGLNSSMLNSSLQSQERKLERVIKTQNNNTGQKFSGLSSSGMSKTNLIARTRNKKNGRQIGKKPMSIVDGSK